MTTKQILTVYPELNSNCKWILTDNGGNELQEGFEYLSRFDALEAAQKLWPSNSVWHGKFTKDCGGWNIEID